MFLVTSSIIGRFLTLSLLLRASVANWMSVMRRKSMFNFFGIFFLLLTSGSQVRVLDHNLSPPDTSKDRATSVLQCLGNSVTKAQQSVFNEVCR